MKSVTPSFTLLEICYVFLLTSFINIKFNIDGFIKNIYLNLFCPVYTRNKKNTTFN